MKTNRQKTLFCALTAALLLGGCKDLFHPEGPEKPKSTTGNDFTPSVPSSVVAYAESSNTITVSWNPVSGASRYNIYRSSSLSGVYSMSGESIHDSYTEAGLQPNTTYYYKVSAYNSYGESARSSSASATTLPSGGQNSIPSAPSFVTADAVSSSTITVSWNPVSGASSYKVYRSNSASGAYSLQGSAYDTSYEDSGLSSNTTYYYKVSAYNSYGESAQSNYASAATQPSGGQNHPLVGTTWYAVDDYYHDIYMVNFISSTMLTLSGGGLSGSYAYDYDGGTYLTIYIETGYPSYCAVNYPNSIYSDIMGGLMFTQEYPYLLY
jgi:hypothetical protein